MATTKIDPWKTHNTRHQRANTEDYRDGKTSPQALKTLY
jgi:hypothetical protein